jgi:transglutaminase-like putative cysteine protease
MRGSDRSTLAVTLAVVLTTFIIAPLTRDVSFLGVSWLLILMLAVLSVVMRHARISSPAVLAAQVVLWALFVLALSFSLPGGGEPWSDHFFAEWTAGIQHMQTQASPMDPNDGVKLIFVCGLGLVMIVTELIVSGLRRPVWALAPLVAVFLVPSIGLSTDTGALSFLLVAAGYLAILVAEGLNTTARWTRGLSSDSSEGHGDAMPVVWRAAGLIGVPALVLTLVLAMLVPTFSLSGLGIGNGPGGNGPLQLTDPTLDLRRNLNQPQNKVVIKYTTDQPGGLYLRMASLPQFNAQGWSNVPMQLDPGEQLPQIPGLATEPSKRRKTTIQVLDFKSEYLPLPFAPRTIQARGNWAFDPQSLIMLSMARGDRANAIRNLTYSVDSVDISPNGKDLDQALAGTPADSSITKTIPKDLPQELITLTNTITADAQSPADKAAAIQQYLRSSRFTYSTETLPGNGYRALVNFLKDDHKGYCEQFAASMAMMARIVGIPSRVAVGFLPGEKKGDHWEVSIRDMHAWPELYFSGYGWVRFEPTPGSVTGAAPSWTVPSTNNPSDGSSNEPSVQPSTSASAQPSRPTNDPGEQTTTVPTATGFPWGRTLVGSGIGILALLILAAPATIRSRRRTGRLATEGPAEVRVERAWEEIRDTVLDYGGSWPEGSPRSIGGEIGHRLEGGDTDTMTRVATLVERSRYARSFADEEATRSLPGMAQEIRRGIAKPQTRWRRLQALVVPRSLFRRRR